jgi:flotillin
MLFDILFVFSVVLAFAVPIGAVAAALLFRVVVQPNEVHIVQGSKATVSYGICEPAPDGDEATIGASLNGNSYYRWPAWFPKIGVQVKVLPLAVFSEELTGYEAYDIGKVPFVVDVVAFFRIADPSIAAKRLTTFVQLREQLTSILQGAVRTILAKHEVEDIMMDRSTFGEMFTFETKDQLRAWGVVNVKNIELMDIRDGSESKTIENIMAKKESLIDMESRTEVANNKRQAEIAEIEANQLVAVRDQEALELVGRRTAEKNQKVGIADEKALQEIKAEAAVTKTREMAVLQIETVRQAEISKEALVVQASQDKETTVIKAEGRQQEQVITAEGLRQETEITAAGVLVQQTKEAEGTLSVGTAEAEAKRLSEMASVSPQLALAAEIGENEGYQTYLIQIREVEKNEVVGVEQAKALQDAGIKVIANTGNVSEGVSSVMDLFSSKGGTALGAMGEAFAQTDTGAEILGQFGVKTADTVVPNRRPNGAA